MDGLGEEVGWERVGADGLEHYTNVRIMEKVAEEEGIHGWMGLLGQELGC